LGPFEKPGNCTTSSFFYEIMSKMVVLLWVLFPRQVGCMLEKFHIISNYKTYKKKKISRKKKRMIQNTKLLTIYIENCKMPFPMVAILE